MGVDLLDIRFLLEKKLGTAFVQGDLEQFKWRKPPDISVAEFQDMILGNYHRKIDHPIRWTNGEIDCEGCRLALRATPVPGFCRYCGEAVSVEQYVRGIVNDCLSDALGVPLNKIWPGAWLIKDLGMA